MNPLRSRLQQGGHAVGTLVWEFFSPNIARIAAAAGADFAIFDMEHGGVGIEAVKVQLAVARNTGCAALVRTPSTEYGPIAAALDAGAVGIMAPMVESVSQAETLVGATRYPPHGRRGAAFGIAHDDFSFRSAAEAVAEANGQTLVIAMIETRAGVENVEAIAAVPGIDVLWVGHFDLTISLGIPGEFEHPRYCEAVDRVLHAAARQKLAAGIMASDVAAGRGHIARGFRMIAYGTDSHLYRDALATGVEAIRGAA